MKVSFFSWLTNLSSYGSCIDAVTYVYCTEIWPMHVRAKGSAVAITGLFAPSVIILSVSPSAFNAITWKYYFVYMGISIIAAVVVWFWWPEVSYYTCLWDLY